MDMEKLFKKYEANFEGENFSEEEMKRLIMNPNSFSKKKVIEQKSKIKKRTKRNRRKN